ncbi:MAG TPA: amidohydrolase family protein [Hyphomonadaceae bacterium]|nr:amidohydrolase family protein [Hyphomonadaceae bacterium]HPN05033.1 amidohydrolase family protein [Hyphomonadaceae bacterium]
MYLMKRIRLFVILTGLAAGATACSHTPDVPPADLVITNVAIVDTRTGGIARDRTLAITDGRIVAIVPRGVAGKQVVDGRGKFIVPGFVDAHIHATEGAASSNAYFDLLVANGVTTIREENVSLPVQQLAERVRKEAASGARIAPDIVFQGGEEHLDPRRSALEQSNAGKPSMDHLGAGWGLILDCSTDEAAIRSDALAHGYQMKPPPTLAFLINPRAFDGELNAPFYRRIIDTYDEGRCRALSEAFVKNKTWQTVTLIRLKTQDFANDPAFTQSEYLRYMSPGVKEAWRRIGDQFAALSPGAISALQDYYALQLRVTKLMSDSGVRILAGSDAAGIWVIPGFGLQQEFRELTRAGLSPLQVLQSATLSPAEFLQRAERSGAVEVGKDADLVLLDGNPIEDVTSLERIAGVVLDGRYLSKNDLDALKENVARSYAP